MADSAGSTDRAGRKKVVLAEAEEIVAVAARLAEELNENAAERDAGHTVPHAEAKALRESGLLGITVPVEHGGPGASYESLSEVFRILASGDPSVAQIPQTHFGFVEVLRSHGTDEQREYFFSRMLEGELFSNGQAERGIAHDQPLRTRLTRAPEDGWYLLDGAKHYCTGSPVADWLRISALDEEGRTLFALVRPSDEGVTVGSDWSAMGQRGTGSGTVLLEGARVPEHHVVRGFAEDRLLGTSFQLMHAAIDLGIADRALRDAAAHVRERTRAYLDALTRGWTSAAEEPHILMSFGRLATRLHAAEELQRRAARLFDRARAGEAGETETAVAVAEAKAFGSEITVELASEVFALMGASATSSSLNLDRHWRNARTHTLHDPARWKYHHAGAYYLNGTPPPAHGQF